MLGGDTMRLRSFRNCDVTHWQATVGHTSEEESGSGDLVLMIMLVSKQLFFSVLSSISKKILAASSARRLPLRSRGCLVSPVLEMLSMGEILI